MMKADWGSTSPIRFLVVPLASFPDNITAVSLMRCQYKNLGYLYVFWCRRCVKGYVGYIICRQRLDAFIHRCRPLGVAMKAHIAEIGFNKPRLQVRHAHGSVGYIYAQSVAQGLYALVAQ